MSTRHARRRSPSTTMLSRPPPHGGRHGGHCEGRPDGDAALLAELVEQGRSGSGRAVARIVELCTPMVHVVARRNLAAHSDIDDVAQDVWLALVTHLDDLTSPTSLRAWLVRVTTHAAWRRQRSASRTTLVEDVSDRASEYDTATQAVDRVHRSLVGSEVRSALAQMPPSDRRLLELLVSDDRPDYRSIGAEIDRPVGSIGPTRQRAMRRMRRHRALARLAGPH